MSWGSLGGALNPLGLRFEAVVADLDGVLTDGVGIGHAQISALIAGAAAADTFRAQGFPAVVRGFSVVLTDGVGTTDTIARIDWGILITQGLRVVSTDVPSQISGVTVTDTTTLLDTLRPGLPVTLTSGVGIEASAAAALALRVLENIGLSGVLLGQATYGLTLAERLRVVDQAANFFGLSASDGFELSATVAVARTTSEVLAQSIGITETLAPQLLISVITTDGVEIAATEALQMLLSGTLSDGVEVRAGYVAPDGSFTAWAMNTRTAAVSEYRDFAFNSFGTVDGRAVAGNADGLFELVGDTDAGDTIVSILRSGFMQFGGTHLSRLKEAYIATRGGGDFVLRITTGLGEEYNYAVTAETMRSSKINMGKGQRARYFAYELTSAGQDFDLDTLEFVPIVVQRRV